MMITFFFNNITHKPDPVDHQTFDFLLEIFSFGAKTIRFTFKIPNNISHVFIVNGARQKRFSVRKDVPDGDSTIPVSAQIDGPTGRIPVAVRGTNTANSQDSVPFGTVVHV